VAAIVTSSAWSPLAGATVTISAQLADEQQSDSTGDQPVTWTATNGGSFASNTTNTNTNGVATVCFDVDDERHDTSSRRRLPCQRLECADHDGHYGRRQ
jgi:hypothetical protein